MKQPFFQFPGFSQFPEITHFITNRHGGISEAPYQSLNIGLMTGDRREHVLENRKRVAKRVGVGIEAGILPQLTHSNHVAVVGMEDAGSGFGEPEKIIPDTDALITCQKNLLLVVTLADCTPIFLYDKLNKVIGIAHAGWKGTIGKIGANTLKKMTEIFGTSPKEVHAGIGVCIQKCCYEVSESLAGDFKAVFGEEGVIKLSQGKQHLDLVLSNKIQLIQAGIPSRQIETTEICTSCTSDSYFSHRKENGLTGRFCAGILLR